MVPGDDRTEIEICDGLSVVMVPDMLKELDPVVLTEALPATNLRPGDVGWIVMVHDGGKGYEVEFVTLSGRTVSVETIPAKALRPVRPNEIANARLVA